MLPALHASGKEMMVDTGGTAATQMVAGSTSRSSSGAQWAATQADTLMPMTTYFGTDVE